MMSRFIVRYTGRGSAPAEDLALIRSLPQVTILDETPRMVLVEAPSSTQDQLQELKSWVVAEEKSFSLPDPRPKPRST
jgi:hypothetical protein